MIALPYYRETNPTLASYARRTVDEVLGDVGSMVSRVDRVAAMAVTIAVESPLQDEVRELIAALNAYLLTITPQEFCTHLTVEQMADADTTVFIARDEGRAVACGALRRHASGVGEVKRMYTVPAQQGQGIGGRILARIEELAREEGFTRLVLETGHDHAPAWRVYERGGFTRCGPVLDYPDTGYSIFYEKAIAVR